MSIDILNETEFALDELELVACARYVMTGPDGEPGYDEDVVADETAGGAVPLGRLLPAALDSRGRRTAPRVVVYRRPLEARAGDRADLAELVHDVVVDQVARLLQLDPDEVDPPDGS